MRGTTIVASVLMHGFFNLQESNGDLTRDHYLNSPPIEPSVTEFLLTRNSKVLGQGIEPALLSKDESSELSSHPISSMNQESKFDKYQKVSVSESNFRVYSHS